MGEQDAQRPCTRPAVITAALLLALVTTGCTTQPVIQRTESAPQPAPTSTRAHRNATQASSTVPTYPRLPSGTVVATGDFTSPANGTTGHVEITAYVGTDFQIAISNFHTILKPGDLYAALAKTVTPTSGQCASGIQSIAATDQTVTAAATQSVPLALPDSLTAGDPTNLDYLTITQDAGTPACSSPVLAEAHLTWTWPKRYTTIPVTDSGERAGARGTTTRTAGAITSYAVHAGDTQSAILARFGITLDELQFLNPSFFQDGVSSVTKENYVWNLSIAAR